MVPDRGVERDHGFRIVVRWVLVEALVRAVIVEMVHVLVEDGVGVSFVVDQQPIGALFANAADEPVGFENPVGDAGLRFSELLGSRFVLVNQPVEDPLPFESLGGEAGWRRLGWSAALGAVWPVLVVVRQVLGEHLPQVSFTIDEQVVGAFPAQGTNPALADRVCPGRLDRSPDDLDAFGSEDGVEAGGVFGVPVPDQEPKRCLEVHEQVTGLLGHPRPGRVLGEAKKVHSSSGVLDTDKHVEPLAQEGVDMQEVDRENAASLCGEELSPTRSGPSRCGRQACMEQDGAHG